MSFPPLFSDPSPTVDGVVLEEITPIKTEIIQCRIMVISQINFVLICSEVLTLNLSLTSTGFI